MYPPSHARIRAFVKVEGTHRSHPDREPSSLRMLTFFLTVVTGREGYSHA
jgi:hypothetical protein